MLLVRDLVLTPSPSETGDSQPWMHSRITAELKKILMLRPHSGPVKSKCVCVAGVGGERVGGGGTQVWYSWLCDAAWAEKDRTALKSGPPAPSLGARASVLIMCIRLFFRNISYN